MFEKASKLRLRFGHNGSISTEDLWDLPLEELNTVAKNVNKALKESTEESFITTKTAPNKLDELRFSIVKRVIEVKLEEAAKAKTHLENKARRARLLEIISNKQDVALENKSVKALLAEYEALGEED